MAIGLGEDSGGIVAEKESSCDREPCIADHIRIAEEAGQSAEVHQIQFAFGSIDDCLIEGDGIAYAGIEKLVVVGIVSYVTAIKVDVQAQPVREAFSQPSFVVVPQGRFDGEAQKLVAE